MKKKKLIIIISFFIVILALIIIIFNKKDKETYTITNDSLKFKNEYSFYNGDSSYLNIEIKSYNSIVYSSYDEIYKVLDKETGIILLASPSSNYSRAFVMPFLDWAFEEKIDKIYYLDISSDRNELVKKKKKIKTIKKGSEDYLNLVEKLKDYLPVYDGLDDDTIKRIYLPSVIFVKEGKIITILNNLPSYAVRTKDEISLMNETEINELKEILSLNYEKLSE